MTKNLLTHPKYLLLLVILATFSAQSNIAVLGATQDIQQKSAQDVEEALEAKQDIQRISTDQELGLHPWQRYVRGFRKKHHFSLILGASKRRWDFTKVNNILRENFSNSAINVKFKYHYHLKINYNFGFLLGTSVGLTKVFKSSESAIDTIKSSEYPGILAGLVYNRSPNFRAWLGIERYLERMDPISIEFKDGATKNSLTMTTYDVTLGIDYFVLMQWALTFEAHYRYGEHNRLQSKENSTNSLSIEFEREDFGLGFGATFHIL